MEATLPPVTPPLPKVEPIAPPPPPPPQPPEAEPVTKPMMATEEVFCEGCGSPLRPTDKFCGKCGQQQTAVASP